MSAQGRLMAGLFMLRPVEPLCRCRLQVAGSGKRAFFENPPAAGDPWRRMPAGRDSRHDETAFDT